MFRESLLETSAATLAHRGWATLMSFGFEMTGIAALVIAPLFVSQAVPMFQAPPVPPTTSVTAQQIKDAMKLMAGGDNAAFDGTIREPVDIPDHIFIPKGPEHPRGGGAVQLMDCPTCVFVPYAGPNGPENSNMLSRLLEPTPGSHPAAKLAVAPPSVIHISRIDEGMLISRVEPIYPPAARIARVQGEVLLAAIVGRDGRVENLRVVRGHPLLVGAAVNAVSNWRYRPTMLNGQPVEVDTTIAVKFILRQD